ncbi:Crp/Fnr family transcriptional regulator [Simkania negevensis]|uniref:Crp/Fnr family transcriptional regulator n=1 Tax=Simkania negevensis TaxID=83561 RepID=A0ABS3ASF7_9BACT|nr:Crp/Fnr family transcriptional regulator [Simkania negevensis]
MNLTKLIKRSSFFRDFAPHELQLVLKNLSVKIFNAHERILSKGDPATALCILLGGRVGARLFETHTTPFDWQVEEGNCFGNIALVSQSPHPCHYIAMADNTTVLQLPATLVTEQNSPLRDKVLTKMSEQLANYFVRIGSFLGDWLPQSGNVGIYEPLPPSPKQEVVPEKEIAPAKKPLQKQKVANKRHAKGEEEGKEEEEEEEPNPFGNSRGIADKYDNSVHEKEEYDVLERKISLRTDFIFYKLPRALPETVCKKLYGYWTGGKLAKVNTHCRWNPKTFTPGTPRLKKALHLIVIASDGEQAYRECYLNLPFSQHIIGLIDIGCAGTFLGSDEAIDRYLNDENLKKAIIFDFDIAIDRISKGKEVIEFLTHTTKDVREQTLFLVFDNKDGNNTQKVRKRFPTHQIVTVVKGTKFDDEEPSSMFSQPEEDMSKEGIVVIKNKFRGKGFYSGETFFLPDYSIYFEGLEAMGQYGYIFATMTILCNVGPDYSGIVWGSKGGTQGAARAAKAMFGLKGPQSVSDIVDAISWADD